MSTSAYWGWTGLAVLAAMGLLALACWLDDLWTARADRRQDTREGWTEPLSSLDRADRPATDELMP